MRFTTWQEEALHQNKGPLSTRCSPPSSRLNHVSKKTDRSRFQFDSAELLVSYTWSW